MNFAITVALFILVLTIVSNINGKITKSSLFQVIWFVFFGIEIFVSDIIFALFFCITIIGIPLGIRFFKAAFYDLNLDVELKPVKLNPYTWLLNWIWFLLIGFWVSCINYLFVFLWRLFDATTPLGDRQYKLAKFISNPLGVEYVDAKPKKKHHRHHYYSSYYSSAYESDAYTD